jgi:hypothetical protein
VTNTKTFTVSRDFNVSVIPTFNNDCRALGGGFTSGLNVHVDDGCEALDGQEGTKESAKVAKTYHVG